MLRWHSSSVVHVEVSRADAIDVRRWRRLGVLNLNPRFKLCLLRIAVQSRRAVPRAGRRARGSQRFPLHSWFCTRPHVRAQTEPHARAREEGMKPDIPWFLLGPRGGKRGILCTGWGTRFAFCR